ncbi:hypothetical protein L1987_50518 [Smallanthus sonchifolius]|uniref:Uncharacterized protein n=1 Tax=Smallanthus sonchifolius TaxID=185202 RepID=A0ACB9ENJ0_9ASTR|nr:hypothetical protein L1987_50518 [Smallanthus sonchifolius]
MAGLVQGQNGKKRMEKQIGCMSGFLQIFDRQHILAGKRILSTKRLPPSTGVGASPETGSSGESHESEPLKHAVVIPAIPDKSQSSPTEKMNHRPKSPVVVPTFEQKDGTQKSSWKAFKEIHRHSLDSRITVRNTSVSDEDDNQRRSPSVIARLMGLEPLSSSDQKTEIGVKPALRRSASESRVSRDLVYSKYIDDNNFQVKQQYKSQNQIVERIVRDETSNVSNRDFANLKSESSRTSSWRSRSFFDSAVFFQESNQTTVTMHGDFEKRLKMRGMDEQSNDLSTLKQILEVLQLKGLLRSTRHSNRDNQRNVVYDRNLYSDESSIVLVKPWRSSASKVDYQRSVNDSRRTCRYASENFPATSPKRDGGAVDWSGRSPVRVRTSSPNRIGSNLKSCDSISKRKPLNIEIQRRDDESSGSINSPKLTPKRNGSVHHSVMNRSHRNQKPSKRKFIKNVVTEDGSSSISESIISTPSTIDSERPKREESREGKNLLQRCDEQLSSIAEMNSTTESPPSSATVLPSPVSVLDSGFDKDEPSTPSHCIDLKATPTGDFKDENVSPKLSPAKSTKHEEFTSDDPDFIYISEIVQASQHLHEGSDVFFSFEKQLNNTENSSNVSKRQHKLIFDVVLEIIGKNKQFPPWKAFYEDSRTSLKQIWSEFQKIREINTSDGLLELVSGVLKKDLLEINGWRDYPIEKSETVLDIERMIFKDLVSEAIRDLAEIFGEYMFFKTRRKLVF